MCVCVHLTWCLSIALCETCAGLCILDLVKHACKTVLATLEANDRFGLVTFESQARCELPLQFVTEAYREQAMTAISAMHDMGGTNLWGTSLCALTWHFEHIHVNV